MVTWGYLSSVKGGKKNQNKTNNLQSSQKLVCHQIFIKTLVLLSFRKALWYLTKEHRRKNKKSINRPHTVPAEQQHQNSLPQIMCLTVKYSTLFLEDSLVSFHKQKKVPLLKVHFAEVSLGQWVWVGSSFSLCSRAVFTSGGEMEGAGGWIFGTWCRMVCW